MGSHFGTTLSFSRLNGIFPSFLRHTGQIHLLLYVLFIAGSFGNPEIVNVVSDQEV
jgi:hypothetical protein